MKTTPAHADHLQVAAKRVAVRRRTRLKSEIYELGEYGLLRLKKRGAVITSELVRQMMQDEGI